MSYYSKVLLPDETVLHVGRIHWSVYLRPWLSLVAAIAAAIAYVIDSTDETALRQGLGIVAALFALIWLLGMLQAWVRRRSTEIVVTDRRILFKEGLVRRRTVEMNMNKVETVDVVQSLTGRLLDFGTILIRGTGSTYEPLRRIADPLKLRSAIVAR